MAAEELNKEKLEGLKRQVELFGLDEQQRNKIIIEEWRRMGEADAEERRFAALAEERRIATEAEAEQQRLAALAEEPRTAAKEKKAEFEVEKLRLELEARSLSQSYNGKQLNQGLVENVVRTPLLSSFVDGKDSLDECPLRFERYADVAK